MGFLRWWDKGGREMSAPAFRPEPRFRAMWKWQGQEMFGAECRELGHAESQAREAVAKGATFAMIQRDSGGTDHPANAGKWFLYQFIKA